MSEKNLAEMLWIKKRYRNIKPVRWHRLWIARAVMLAALIVLGGYLASIAVVVQGVNTVSRLAFAGDVDRIFGAIRPLLIRQQIAILCIMAFFLVLAMVFMVRSFKTRIDELLEGVMTWSQTDASFRFGANFSGELKLISDQFNMMADELEVHRRKSLYLEKMASWQIIARKMAHEIKNPLTPIQMMMAQLVRGYAGDDEKYKLLLANSSKIITEEVAALRRMVDSFSEFARLPEPKPVTHDLASLCLQVVKLQKAAFINHDIQFETKLKEANAFLDPQLIKQVLVNLVKNAAEACGQGMNSKIVLRLEAGTTGYRIHVIDNGPGIPPEMQKRIFEAYFTTKNAGPAPGLGLGLSICQKIIMDHKGDLFVESVPGHTDFQVILPHSGSTGG